jgi:tetratricopeptide (TPR) repeat protein
LRRKQYDKAAFHLERADPDPQVYEGLITSFIALGRLGAAEEQAEKAKAIDGPPPGLTKALELVQSLGKARDDLVARLPPAEGLKKAAERCVCAEHLHQTQAPAAAVEAVLKPEKDLPELAPALELRALLALEKGRLRQAADDIDKAVRLGTKEPRAFCVRGRVKLERGHTRSALLDLERAAELSGRKDATALHWLAAALAASGRTAEAIKAQQEAVKLKPDDPQLVEQLRALESQ